MANVFTLDHVTVAFGGVKAVDDLSLSVDDGPGILGIIGPNGAGKSTALSVLCGARRPTSGSVTVLGHKYRGAAHPSKAARMGVGRTFQIPRPFVDMTIRENVMVALIADSFASPRKYDAQADEILTRFGLIDIAENKAGALPLAQRKKLEVARAVATTPRLLLLDEVFEGLSDVEINDMVTILRGLAGEGIKLVLVEHVLRALRQLATEMVVLEKGKIIAEGPVDDVLASDRVKAAYLGFGGAAT
jgi:ABC-type branched-subunit amino acid transport system ATPase component